jgi:recombination protein RecT
MSNTQLAPVEKMRNMIAARKSELAKVLPEHINIESFERAINNAMMRNPDIASCDPLSVYDAGMRCAQDGLIPDGREAIINTFKSKGGMKAQYQPMIDGVLKRLRQSGLIENIAGKAVFNDDEFDYWFDEDGEHLKYRPAYTKSNFKLAFAYAKLKGGEMVVEVMPKHEIDKVKAASKSGGSAYSPWSTWYERMAVKSVLHRLAKRLPNSSEVSGMLDNIERDINVDFDTARDVTNHDRPKSLTDALAQPQHQEYSTDDSSADIGDIFNDEGNE